MRVAVTGGRGFIGSHVVDHLLSAGHEVAVADVSDRWRNRAAENYGADLFDAAALDQLNKDIVADVQESGVAAPSTTRIKGRLAIRVNITNHRTQRGDLDVLVDAVLNAGQMR